MNIKLWLAAFDFIIIVFLKIFYAWMSTIIVNKLWCFWIFNIFRFIKYILRMTFKIFLWAVYISNRSLDWASPSDIVWIIKNKVCLSQRWRSSCYLARLLLHLEEIVVRYYFELEFSYTVNQFFVFIF